MDLNDRIEKLEQAKRLVMEVRDSLTKERIHCDHCNSSRPANYRQFAARDMLNGVLTRIDKATGSMRTKPKDFS